MKVLKNSPIRGWRDLSKNVQKMSKMSIIELSWSGQDLFDFSDFTWAHPLTPGVSTNYKSSNGIELFRFSQDLLNFLSFELTPTIDHWPTQPPTHPPMGVGLSTNHKSSKRIELPWLGQYLLNF